MLKALELAGFKSFADKTRLEFGAGVTCVVGPNGSGKSNVVDAIKWVTGSQSAKALRGKEMTDVIFSGSATRRQLNAAEVTLEFDNAGGLFDLQSPVVRITRRVYRSGEGEYLINGAVTRLRDIRTLLAGTGIGAEAYSIIEQGRVDAMLRASPRDRRAIFEEAAGVSRFRLKKKEAAKRLARVEQNLLRLSDIVDEVEGRLRRVKKQAGKAQHYRDASHRLKQLRTTLGVADYRTLSRRAQQLRDDASKLAAEHKRDAQTLEAAELELTRLEAEGAAAGGRLADLDRRLADLREQLGAAKANLFAQQAREQELQEELGHKRNRLRGIVAQGRRPDTGESLDLAALHRDAQQALQQAQQRLAQARTVHQGSKEELAELTQRRAEIKRAHTQAEQACRDLTLERDGLDEKVRRLAERADKAAVHRAESEDALRLLTVEAAEAKDTVDAGARRLESLSETHSQRAEETEQLRTDLAAARQAEAAAQTQVVRLQHQLEAIDQIEHDLATVRDTLAAAGEGHWRVLGMVADVLHVDYDSAPLVEAALGDRAHHLVIDSGVALINGLVTGRLTLEGRVCLERLDSQNAASVVDRIDLAAEAGVMGRADQFVECDTAFAPLVRRLLGRIWFVDTLQTAERLSQGPGRGLGFVTYAGESLTADGVLTLGPKQRSRNLLTRKQQAVEMQQELSETEQEVVHLGRQIAELEGRVASCAAAATEALDQRTQASDALAEARHAWRRTAEQQQQAEEDRARLAAELQQLSTERNTADQRQQAVADQLAEAHTLLTTLSEQAEQLKRVLQEAQHMEDLHAQQVVELQVALAGAQQRAEVLQTQWRQSQHGGEKIVESQRAALADERECRQRIEQCRLRQLNARSTQDLLALEAEQLAHARRQAAAAADESQARRTAIAHAVRDRRKLTDAVLEDRRQREVELVQVEQQQETLCARLKEDYSIDLPKAASEAPDAAPVEDRQAVEREIAALREDVQSVGAVNLESIEELDDLEARFNELSEQYQDLTTAKNALVQLTRQISAQTRKLFLSTIEEVRGEFRELFGQLFGGGEADLVLVDGEGDDPLDAGIEIAAQPPGKDLSNITLLSGGEKTMTCVALLLALFRTKPSPFCVLDEVDAALDEANIGRFTSVLHEFLSSTQFIVITHSKRTMTGANTMYGITMQESGVSKQVSVRFEEVDEEGNIRTGGTRRAAA